MFDETTIGQLFLQGGNFQGQQILSENYISQAISPLKCNPGYGFLWWIWDKQYGCCGFGGQSVTVIPDYNAIVVTQATPTSRGMIYDDVIQYCIDILKS